MSEKLCALEKIGGGMSETVLWTNPSPTSAFGSQTITLSNAISNYKYVAFDFIVTTSTSVDDYNSEILSVDDVRKSIAAQNNYVSFMGGYLTGGVGYTRAMFYNNDTSISFDNCNRVGVSGGANNSLCVPLRIVGLK